MFFFFAQHFTEIEIELRMSGVEFLFNLRFKQKLIKKHLYSDKQNIQLLNKNKIVSILLKVRIQEAVTSGNDFLSKTAFNHFVQMKSLHTKITSLKT